MKLVHIAFKTNREQGISTYHSATSGGDILRYIIKMVANGLTAVAFLLAATTAIIAITLEGVRGSSLQQLAIDRYEVGRTNGILYVQNSCLFI